MKTKNVYNGKIYVLACVPDVPMDVEKVDVRHCWEIIFLCLEPCYQNKKMIIMVRHNV